MKLSLRTAIDPSSLAQTVRAEIRALDPSLPVTAVQTLAQVVRESAGPQRFNAILLTSFAILALLLAALGVGGILATSTSRRTQELGVRLALGASGRELLWMVVREGMTLVVLGMMIGLPASYALTRLMSSLLFEVNPGDPMTFITVALLLMVVALVACYVPARRATRIEPMAALRGE